MDQVKFVEDSLKKIWNDLVFHSWIPWAKGLKCLFSPVSWLWYALVRIFRNFLKYVISNSNSKYLYQKWPHFGNGFFWKRIKEWHYLDFSNFVMDFNLNEFCNIYVLWLQFSWYVHHLSSISWSFKSFKP